MKNHFSGIRYQLLIPLLIIQIAAGITINMLTVLGERKSLTENASRLSYGKIKDVSHKMKVTGQITDQFLDSLETNYIRTVKMLAFHLSSLEEMPDSAQMQRIAENIKVKEIHVSDENGILRWGNIPDFYGYDYASDSQSSAFLPALKNPDFTYAQAPTPRGADKVLFQYIGCSLPDRPGIVQIGIEPRETKESIDKNSLSDLVTFENKQNDALIYLTDLEGRIQSTSNPQKPFHISEMNWPVDIIGQKKSEGFFSFSDKDDNKTFVRYRKENDHYIIIEIPSAFFAKAGANFRNLLITTVLFTMILSYLAIYLLSKIKVSKPLKLVQSKMDSAANGDLTQKIDYHSSDEIGGIAEQADILIDSLKQSINSIKSTVLHLNGSVQDLFTTSKEVNSTAQNQSSAVKEVVSTMEDSNKLSKNVEKSISEVASISNHTKEDVEKGVSIISETKEQMAEIQVSNQTTIEGIKILGEQIDTIWDIVNIINNIADQTKIIAFNAELEASSAGNAGKNFEIVASEIRRLADNTVSSTKEIKNKISEIQNSSNQLILTSEEGTRKIQKGNELSVNLDNVFKEILNSAEISASSASHISESTKQQVESFEQTLITMKQIAEGTNTFADSTKYITEISKKIQVISNNLKQLAVSFHTEESNGDSET